MAIKRVGYKEPADYFSEDMLKAVREYDKKQAAEKKKTAKPTTGKKSK